MIKVSSKLLPAEDRIPDGPDFSVKDIRLIATLLASGDVSVTGTDVVDGTVYVLFRPYELAQDIVNGYYSYTAPNIQPKVLLEKFEDARSLVFRTKDQYEYQRNRSTGGQNET